MGWALCKSPWESMAPGRTAWVSSTTLRLHRAPGGRLLQAGDPVPASGE